MMFVVLGIVILGSIPAALVLVLVARRDLREIAEAQRALTARVAALERGAPLAPPLVAPRTEAPPVAPPALSWTPPPRWEAPTAGGVTPAPSPTARTADLESVVGSQWLTWIGILAIFFGTAFFLGVDLGESVMSGMGQVLVGVLVGALFLGTGHVLTRRKQVFLGWGLLGGGVALFYLAAYAAHGFHELVSAWVVYPFLVGVALVGAALAVTHNSRMIATLTLAGAYLTPLLLSTETDLTYALLPYLVAVSVGALRLAASRRWALILYGAFLGTLTGMIYWWAEHPHEEHRVVALVAGGTLAVLFAAVSLLASSDEETRRDTWNTARAVVIPVNGLLFALHVSALFPPEHTALRGAAFALLGVGHLLAARGRTPSLAASAAHYTGLLLVAIAVPLHFDRAWVTLGWIVLGATLTASGLDRGRRGDRLAAFAVYALALIRATLLDTTDALEHAGTFRLLLNESFLTGLLLTAALALTGFAYRRARAAPTVWEARVFTPLLLVAASLFLWKLCFETVVFFEARERALGVSVYKPTILTLSLVIAVYGGVLILGGFLARYRPIRLLGVAVLAFLILKMFVLDMQVLERGYRIASFVGVGVLFLAISLLYQRERRR